ncbi:hypothetical protein R0K30_22765, partial [Bacillus sp. SIMBA_154]|uniref:hypothetical protein n=1 Tax=Bacillus sp. SIMBA_154 TaxID=3080859 RepID=UPI00397C02FF
GHFNAATISGAWAVDGVRYAAYNLNALAAVLFIVPRFAKTQHAVGAGLLAGVVAIVPGIFVFLTLLANSISLSCITDTLILTD